MHPNDILDQRLQAAKQSIELLGLDKSKPLDILELGAGIGHLSYLLEKYNHSVTCCDHKDYINNKKINGSARGKAYAQTVELLNMSKQHFYYEPNDNNAFENFKKYDYVLWQNNSMWQNTEYCTKQVTVHFFNGLVNLLNPNGKLIIGYYGEQGKDSLFEQSECHSIMTPHLLNGTLWSNFGYYVWQLKSDDVIA